jgi:hypothetical protein
LAAWRFNRIHFCRGGAKIAKNHRPIIPSSTPSQQKFPTLLTVNTLDCRCTNYRGALPVGIAGARRFLPG